ncbi:MAG: hypothetical protein RSE44_29085, partial [Pseudomonas sp.]
MSSLSIFDPVFLVSTTTALIGSFLLGAFYIYIANTRTDTIFKHLSNCHLVQQNRFYLHMGIW